MTRRVDISYKTILFSTALLISLWILFLIRDVILLLFVAFIFTSALSPIVNSLVRLKLPRVLAIIVVFLLLIAVLVSIITLGLTPLIDQTSNLSQRLIEALSGLLRISFIDQTIIQQEISNLSRQAINFTLNVFENFIGLVSVLVMTFYLLLDKGKIENRVTALFGEKQEKAQSLLKTIEEKLGAWLRGQVVLSLLIGVLVYIGLLVLGIDYALPLAIIAALLEIVPVLGPIISAIPAILIALTISPVMAVIVGGFYFVIQEFEGHVAVPQLMKRAVGLNPILVILAISVGGRLLGIGGALLAVPIAVVIQVVLQDFFKYNTSA